MRHPHCFYATFALEANPFDPARVMRTTPGKPRLQFEERVERVAMLTSSSEVSNLWRVGGVWVDIELPKNRWFYCAPPSNNALRLHGDFHPQMVWFCCEKNHHVLGSSWIIKMILVVDHDYFLSGFGGTTHFPKQLSKRYRFQSPTFFHSSREPVIPSVSNGIINTHQPFVELEPPVLTINHH